MIASEAVENLMVVGLSFKTSELSARSRFAFNADACRDAYSDASSELPFFVLSTCNRTELYAWTSDFSSVAEILKRRAQCTMDELERIVYRKNGTDAIDHFFRVAAGLESQIVGDYDIIAQIKTAFRWAKGAGRSNGILEKLFNFALQASKDVKNNTSFSDGTMSVPYAVIKQLNQHKEIKTITVAGAGETGELMLQYIRDYLPQCSIRLVNRDEEKRQTLGLKFDALQFPITALAQSLVGSDALIVTTNAAFPIVEREHLEKSNLHYVFDLSVPRNVSTRVYNMNNITVLDIDRISEGIQGNINSRQSEIPKVEKIISDYSVQFVDWLKRRELYTSSSQQ